MIKRLASTAGKKAKKKSSSQVRTKTRSVRVGARGKTSPRSKRESAMVGAAEDIFLMYDAREAAHGKSTT